MRICNFGSLNIDKVYSLDHFVQRGETISSSALNIYSGGKGLNQSVAMGRAGVEVYHAGAIGRDGQFLVEVLKQSGVHVDYVHILDNVPSGHAIIQNDASGDNCIILFGGANKQITDVQVDDVLGHFTAGDILVLQNEINDMKYIVEKAHEAGMTIMLNPSPMNERILELPLKDINWLILNEVEAGQILGNLQAANFEGTELLSLLTARFPWMSIVLTLGSRGSVCACGGRTYGQKCYNVRAVDTTAAGDTFTGYLVAGIVKDMPVEKAMDLAARASAIAVTRRGAAPSIPEMKEVHNYHF